MPKLDKRTALAAIRVLTGKQFTNGFHPDKKDATLELIDATKKADQGAVATAAIGLLLDQFEKSGVQSRLFRDHDALSLALGIAETYRPEERMAQRLIKTAARAGFHGRFPGLPKLLLNRPPNDEEVILLISSYVEDMGCRGTSTEEKLRELATNYLSEKDSAVQIGRLEKFVRDWDRDTGL